MKILDRLAGLETEYVIRFHPDADLDVVSARQLRPHNRLLFDLVIGELRRSLPAMPAMPGKPGVFLANGGAVWYELARQAPHAALLEGSTPECARPRQLLAYQRAQDELLARAARDALHEAGEITLCKSDRDAAGHVYGSQENYECTLATGWRWQVWRVGLLLLLPTLALVWLGLVAVLLGIIAYYVIAALLVPALVGARRLLGRAMARLPDEDAIRRVFLGKGLLAAVGAEADFDFLPTWLYGLLYQSFHVISIPMAVGLSALGRLTAFVEVRRKLTPFLITRAIFTGSGRVLPSGRYDIASKASGLNCAAATNEVLGLRPLYSFGHFLKAYAMGAFARSTKLRPLLNRRQRLQISLGDGNLCEEAEYLRIGTTTLVLDAIEAGALPPTVPRIRRPLRAMRRLIADPTLATRLRVRRGRWMSPIEVQRFYLDACRAFIARNPDAPSEAHDVLRRWGEVLDLLEKDRAQLIGRVDWITKRFLLGQCGAGGDDDTSWAACKKIDLRYHELSADGYFNRLRTTGMVATVLTERELDEAMRNPPPDTAAAVRGRYVREFAADPTARASWQCITLGSGQDLRVLNLARHATSPDAGEQPTASPGPSLSHRAQSPGEPL